MLTSRLILACLAAGALLPACGNTAAPAPPAAASGTAASSAGAAPSPDTSVKGELATLVAACTWTANGISYCDALNAFSAKLGPPSEARRATVQTCFSLLRDPEVGSAAATCVANHAEKSQVEAILGALEAASDRTVRIELSRGIDRLHAEDGAPATHVITMVRALAPEPDEHRIVNHLLSALMPEDEKKDVTKEAFALALEIFKAADRAPMHAAALNVLAAAPSRLPEVCKLLASAVETSTDEWIWAAAKLGEHKECEADLGRVFPALVKKITRSDGGKGLATASDLDGLLLLDAQYPLSAAQKKSLVAAVDSLAGHAETEAEKREIQSIHAHYTR